MKFPQFIGGSYQSQSTLADCERTINWYPEKLESGGATAATALYPTPGVRTLSTANVGNGRSHFAMNGREFAIIGTALLEVSLGGSTTNRGTVALDSNPATISTNGDLASQLFITSGGNGYLYDLDTNTLTAIAALAGKATHGGYLDGYFLCLDANTSTFYFSALADGASWTTGIDFAQRSLAPDRWLSMAVVGRYIWLFGETTTEVWYDTGQSFPFAPAPSGFLTYGIAAPFSVGIIGQDVIWLGRSQSGKRCVLRAQGFTPEVISTYPLESAFETYTDITAAVGDVYSDRGHTFYLISFDLSPNPVTWAWDMTTGLWSERGTWIPSANRYNSWRPRFYAYAWGQHRMLDSAGGSIFHLSANYTTDVGGEYIRRVRRAPAISNENKRVFYSSFELDLEPGLGDPKPTVASYTVSQVIDSSTVTGTVTTDVSLEVGVPITMTVDGVAWPGGSAITNGSGVYTFLAVPAGTIVVACAANGGGNTGTTVPPNTLTLDIAVST